MAFTQSRLRCWSIVTGILTALVCGLIMWIVIVFERCRGCSEMYKPYTFFLDLSMVWNLSLGAAFFCAAAAIIAFFFLNFHMRPCHIYFYVFCVFVAMALQVGLCLHDAGGCSVKYRVVFKSLGWGKEQAHLFFNDLTEHNNQVVDWKGPKQTCKDVVMNNNKGTKSDKGENDVKNEEGSKGEKNKKAEKDELRKLFKEYQKYVADSDNEDGAKEHSEAFCIGAMHLVAFYHKAWLNILTFGCVCLVAEVVLVVVACRLLPHVVNTQAPARPADKGGAIEMTNMEQEAVVELVVCPPGVQPGDSILITTSMGHNVGVTVPEGIFPTNEFKVVFPA